ncbi:MAG: NADH-quinone oxidoreductase subunit L [Candidatus Sericytochromatia bacterium]|nr:NADH-quinone oxidoreductase subunit L [Candidatus Sericytochromatia bacterium]
MSLLTVILLAPFLGALLSGLLSLAYAHDPKSLPKATVTVISCTAPVVSFAAAVVAFFQVRATGIPLIHSCGAWIQSGSLAIDWGLRLDALSAVMILVITGIGSLIHIYSTAYMHEDAGYGRYFTYLNLFTGSMLILVLADNLGLMFLGWEGVGVCSYLLIGYWFSEAQKAAAASKAFIVNRIGDAGLLLGMFLLFSQTQTLNFETLNHLGSGLPAGLLMAATALLFIGAIGKSGQIPLHVWLPDAMAGPTPVSALIHAATMVTAGVYLVARMNGLFSHAPEVSTAIAVLGTATAIFAATCGMAQTNIKKVLAYSTVSQLGYMFLAVGVGAYSAGVFHLMTHAFFKALLFLAAGAVIHGLHNHEDLKDMGGLKDKLPLTRWVFLIATLAIAGFPPFAGFFSKDAILAGAWAGGQPILTALGLFTGGLTSYYMFRLYYLTFEGPPRNKELAAQAHDAPPAMALPLVILAAGSTVVGFLGIPGNSLFDGWLQPVFHSHAAHDETAGYLIMGAALLAAVIGWLTARNAFAKGGEPVPADADNGWFPTLNQAYNVDAAYDAGIVKPLLNFSRVPLAQGVERGVISGLLDGLPTFYRSMSEALQSFQTGRVRDYGYMMLAGTMAIVLYLMATWYTHTGAV